MDNIPHDRKDVILDCAEIHTRDELHDVLSDLLALPEWYGRNLDALHDCLTESGADTRLTVCHAEELRRNLGAYADRFLLVLRNCAGENPAFRLTVEDMQA